MKTSSLLLMSALAVLTVSQCTWAEPKYGQRYGGPDYPRPYYRDPILGDPYFGYVALKCVASSPLWDRLHRLEAGECYLCAESEEPVVETVVVKTTPRSTK